MGFIEIKVDGAKEFERKLKEFEPKVAKKIIRSATRKGAAIVRKKTKQIAPRDTGVLRRSIKTRVGKRNRKGTFALLQNFDTKRFPQLIRLGRNGRRSFYPAAVEYGRAARAGGPKVTKPTRFIRRGFDESSNQAAKKITDELKTGIEAEWKKK